ncbi:response regulator transcription factor [Herbiconiux sp. 11R-BC]|uniref:response regulator n=1 Tax=Herbiconiux sp. 11R-BC TaxID=3111637 RepID=UPI003C033747
MIRLFLVDDHEIVRRGVAELLGAEPDIEVVGEAGSAGEALGRIQATAPDVALLDVRLPDGSGIDLCRQLLSRPGGAGPGTPNGLRCLMLTAYDDDDALLAAVVAGASGYVLKDVRGTRLADSVRAVASGRSLMDPALTRRVAERMRARSGETDPRFASLGLRERQILALIADGMTNRQIGEQLSLAEKTVKNYVSSLLSKLGLERRTQAAVFELEHRRPN